MAILRLSVRCHCNSFGTPDGSLPRSDVTGDVNVFFQPVRGVRVVTIERLTTPTTLLSTAFCAGMCSNIEPVAMRTAAMARLNGDIWW